MTARKLAIVGDTHADEPKRFDDHCRVLDWIADDAAARGCDAMAHTGDIFERRSTANERLAVASWIRRVTTHMDFVAVSGNHDDPRDVELLHLIEPSTRKALIARTIPGTFVVNGFVFHCLPWPRKAHLLAQLEATAGDGDEDAKTALRAILRGFAGTDADGLPSVLVAHVMMSGSRTSRSQPPLVGQDLELVLDDLALAECDFYALGHIHLAQDWRIDDAPVVYPGSPRRCNFGEMEDKSYVIATFEGSRCVEWERVPTPAPAMVHVAGEWREGGLATDLTVEALAALEPGTEVRLRYDVDASERAAAKEGAERRAAQLRESGALVTVEERVRPETRARVPEVAAARSIGEKLTTWWDATDRDPGERREPLLVKLAELEAAT